MTRSESEILAEAVEQPVQAYDAAEYAICADLCRRGVFNQDGNGRFRLPDTPDVPLQHRIARLAARALRQKE